MITAKSITKSFDGCLRLKGVDCEFGTGKTNLIIGKSGSGKTVMLKSLVGLYEVDSGDILYDGRSLQNMSKYERKEIHKEIGMLFQGSALFDSLTVEENVRFPLDMFTNDTYKQRRERAHFCLQRVNLDSNCYNLYPSQISGGMQKRVAIARAISLKPKYLFCDEPNSGLDPVTSAVIDDLIAEITKEYGITTIINTHDMNSVMTLGEHIVFIDSGEKCWEGTRDDILTAKNERLEMFLAPAKRARFGN
ncbi:MAG: ATP-binding cassette domain-containing protein [Bacteroidales bacterium]|jgi:phospholipid/cholesterol/gamma-HCH transport system ATP-binding protein|nr:ATP-binding cassette domain-containing protein [Bacteroidales bacterium]